MSAPTDGRVRYMPGATSEQIADPSNELVSVPLPGGIVLSERAHAFTLARGDSDPFAMLFMQTADGECAHVGLAPDKLRKIGAAMLDMANVIDAGAGRN